MPNYVTQQPSPDLYQLQRRQKMAEQLLQQSQQPQEGQMISGHYVAPSWTQGLARGLQGYFANKELDSIAKSQADLQQQTAQRNQADMSKFADLLKGTPAQTVPELPAQDETGYRQEGVSRQITEIPAVPPDLMEAYKFAATSQNPALQQAGTQGLIQMPQVEAQNQEKRAAREAAFAQQMEVLKQRAEDARVSQAERLQAQADLKQMQIDAQMQKAEDDRKHEERMRRLLASLRQPQQAQIIQTDSGPMQLVNGRAVPIVGPNGLPVAGKVAGASGATPASRAQDAKDALSTISMAEKLIDKATGSGIGNAIDATAAFFGGSTEGAKAAAQLRALEGDLVSKMPKMSGPQSDKDVLLYKQMAGQIGDPNVPADTKKAALQTIREIQNRYAATPAIAPGGLGTPKPSGGIVDFGSLK